MKCRRLLGILTALLTAALMPTIVRAETRIALVIGNSAYKNVSALPNPANDARLFTDLLKSASFEVISTADLSQVDLRRAIRDFAAMVAQKGPDTVALIYFAGHGLQIEGENYLVPVDATITRESDVAIEAVRLNDVMTTLASAPAKTRIVILDACRNNPFSAINSTTGRGLAIVDAPTGSIVSYSTAPGAVALDGSGDNSPFTAALVEIAREPNLPIEQALKGIRLKVHKSTQGQQTPWESSSLTSDFSFFGSPGTGQQVASGAGTAPRHAMQTIRSQARTAEMWRKDLQGRPVEEALDLVIREDDVSGYEQFIALYPSAAFTPRVRGLLERRREMMTWFTAVSVNTPLAFQAFLDRFPTSDLAPTARRMRDRAQLRTQSANLARGVPGLSPSPTGTPAAIPASLPTAPVCSCTPPRQREPERKAAPAERPKPASKQAAKPPARHAAPPPVRSQAAKPRSQPRTSSPPPHRRPRNDAPPPAARGPVISPEVIDTAISIGIGIGGSRIGRGGGGGHAPRRGHH